MSNAIESYAVIYNNPFIMAPLFEAFYTSVPQKPKSALLSYLVLPLVLYPASKLFLVKATVRSSIRTMTKKHDRLFGLSERIEEYKPLTSLCIQHAIDTSSLMVDEDLSVRLLEHRFDSILCPKDSVVAAKKLGRLFAPYEIPIIYRLLGVKKI